VIKSVYTVPDAITTHSNTLLTDDEYGYFIATANWNGTETFTYTMKDSANVTKTASVTVTVNPINDAPTAYNDSIIIDEDNSATIDVLGNDTDIDLHGVLLLSSVKG